MMGGIFIYKQYKILHIYAIIMTIQAMHTPKVAGLDILILRTCAAPTQEAGLSHVEILVQFENNYWLMMVGLILGLVVTYKVIRGSL